MFYVKYLTIHNAQSAHACWCNKAVIVWLCVCTRARKLYTSARIYEWKFGKGEWKLPFASPTERVDFLGFVIIF